MKRIFSGIQPSGNLHIGNYLGAVKQFVELQEKNEAIFCVVDLHAITVPQDPKELYQNSLDLAALYLAAGINPQRSIIFLQSHVPAHTELGWILNTLTPLGELERMTQYKEKVQNTKRKAQKYGIPAGLLNYPTLMAADILLYKTEAVPVGEDQLQHIELTRMIAEKFNKRYGETFIIPRPLIKENSARIMGLDNPVKKMSKSASSHNNYIAILDSPDEIRRKIKIAVTDSGKEIRYDPDSKPAISNLMTIYAAFSGKSHKEIEKQYQNHGYAEFKKDLAELIIEKLAPIQRKYNDFSKEKEEIRKILQDGAQKAAIIANQTLKEVKEKVGLVL